MPADPDDVTPHRPGRSELEDRERLMVSRLGRWWRLQSWVTVAVAIVAVFACYLLLRHA